MLNPTLQLILLTIGLSILTLIISVFSILFYFQIMKPFIYKLVSRKDIERVKNIIQTTKDKEELIYKLKNEDLIVIRLAYERANKEVTPNATKIQQTEPRGTATGEQPRQDTPRESGIERHRIKQPIKPAFARKDNPVNREKH